MADPVERLVEQRLLAGENKLDIWKDSQNNTEADKILFYINNKASLKDRTSFQYVNLALALALAFVTAKELITLFSFGKLDIAFLAGLVVPIQGSTTTQLATCRLARRESPKSANAALLSLARVRPLPANCALPRRIWAALHSRIGWNGVLVPLNRSQVRAESNG